MKVNVIKLVKRRWRTIVGVFVAASGIVMVGRGAYKEGVNDLAEPLENAFKRNDYWNNIFKGDKVESGKIIDEEWNKIYK